MVESNHRHGFLFSNDPFTPDVGLSPPSSAILLSCVPVIRYWFYLPLAHIQHLYILHNCSILHVGFEPTRSGLQPPMLPLHQCKLSEQISCCSAHAGFVPVHNTLTHLLQGSSVGLVTLLVCMCSKPTEEFYPL